VDMLYWPSLKRLGIDDADYERPGSKSRQKAKPGDRSRRAERPKGRREATSSTREPVTKDDSEKSEERVDTAGAALTEPLHPGRGCH